MVWTMPARVAEHPMYHLPGSRVWLEDSPIGIRRADLNGFVSIDLNMIPVKPDPHCPLCIPAEARTAGGRAGRFARRRWRWLRTRFGFGPCEGHEVNAHWLAPLRHGWVDPEGKMRRGKRLKRMRTEEWMRIHPAGHPHIHIQLMEDQIRRLHQHGLNGSLEAKGRWGWTEARMQRLWDACHRYEVPALVKSAYSRPLRAARAVGFQTRYTRDHRRGM
jgi:hypothetical protein